MTSAAAVSDTAKAARATSAVRQLRRSTSSASARSAQPAITASGEVVGRLLDVVGGAEDVAVDAQPGQAGAQLVEGLVDVAGDLERVRPGELLDDEHEARCRR